MRWKKTPTFYHLQTGLVAVTCVSPYEYLLRFTWAALLSPLGLWHPIAQIEAGKSKHKAKIDLNAALLQSILAGVRKQGVQCAVEKGPFSSLAWVSTDAFPPVALWNHPSPLPLVRWLGVLSHGAFILLPAHCFCAVRWLTPWWAK